MGLYGSIHYEGGYPEIKYPTNMNVRILNGITFYYFDSFKKVELFIPKDKIISVDFENKSSRSIGKTATGAIVGGLLTGGLGLIAGAAIGARKKNYSKLYLTINYHERNCVVILGTGKKTDQIYSEIMGLFSVI